MCMCMCVCVFVCLHVCMCKAHSDSTRVSLVSPGLVRGGSCWLGSSGCSGSRCLCTPLLPWMLEATRYVCRKLRAMSAPANGIRCQAAACFCSYCCSAAGVSGHSPAKQMSVSPAASTCQLLCFWKLIGLITSQVPARIQAVRPNIQARAL